MCYIELCHISKTCSCGGETAVREVYCGTEGSSFLIWQAQ